MWVVLVKFLLLILLTSRCKSKEKTCLPKYFDCGNGKCIAEIWFCDGYNDCGNFNDEKDCDNRLKNSECLSSQFQCATDQFCIPQKWQCDGERDCPDGSDEIECDATVTCESGFMCRNHQCIPPKWQCDGNIDCTDGSDEEYCPQEKLCTDSEFRCSSGSCILKNLVCNGNKDCIDGSDEGLHCGDPCENANCSQNCNNSPKGPQCYCNAGYVLDTKDNKTCNDIDECQQEGFCSHNCTNTMGGYECICLNGYELFNRTCKASGDDTLLIYSNKKEVRGIRLKSNQVFLVARAVSYASAVDLDPKSQRVYWIEVSNRSKVYSAKTDGSGLRTVISHGLLVPEDIAVDYITNNLYITDSGLKQILACKADGRMCHILHENAEKPRSIALDLDSGLMYWSDWSERSGGIYRSGMDGYNLIWMVSDHIGWPNGIALDHTTNRLYWADAKMETIEYITLDGTVRKVLLKGTVYHPYSLAVFEDTIYWSDWGTFSLESCNKFTGHKITILARQNDHRIMGVHVYHPVLTSKVSNPCWSNGCSHMCLMSPVKGFRCACPDDFKLSTDGKTCENNLKGCLLQEFQCESDENCIDRNLRCNGRADCDDESDEKNCPVSGCDGFNCHATGHCIPWSKVCDGLQDCEDLSDEDGLCSKSCSSQNDGCSDRCQKTPYGSKCFCNKGYSLLPDNKTCDDIDECLEFGTCSHFCNNTRGSFNCSCGDGYVLHNNRFCKAEGESATLVYLLENQIRGLDLNSHSQHVFVNTTNVGIRGIDYDTSEGIFYWAAFDGSVSRYYTRTLNEEVVCNISSRPVIVKYDWITQNVYYLDELSSIGVCTKDGQICEVLVQPPSEIHFDSMAIAPTYGVMFWTSWADIVKGQHSGFIERAEMDGSRRIPIVSDKLLAPTAIAVDHILEMICWSDKELNILECADFRGFRRRNIIQSEAYQPLALGVFEDDVYWADWGTDTVIRCNKFIKGECKRILETNVKTTNMFVAHKAMQPKAPNKCLNMSCGHICVLTIRNPVCICKNGLRGNKTCELPKTDVNTTLPTSTSSLATTSTTDLQCPDDYCNGDENCVVVSGEFICMVLPVNTSVEINECELWNCSHFCSKSNGSYICSCATGYSLKDDKRSCIADGETPMLVYLTGNLIRGLDLNSRSLKLHLIMKGTNTRGMDYDVAEDVFYWTELNDGTIESYSTNNGHEVLYKSCSRPVTVRYDWLARNLYFLDENSNIGVCTKDGKICRTLVKSGAERIDSLAISPLSGYMFWTTWDNSYHYNLSGAIVRAEMDGSNILKIVNSAIYSPTAITVDIVLERIYWADIKLKCLESADFNGLKRRQVVKSEIYHPVASVVFEDNIYWIDWGTESINRCHKFIAGRCENITEGKVKAHDLLVAHKVMQPKKNSSMCLIESGGCSHLCLTAGSRRTCACPSAMTLDVDGRTCIAKMCEEKEFRCGDGTCLPGDFRCDGSKQCNDGSDETECGHCIELGMHRCIDGTCVNNYQICDGKTDCSNNEDELNCSLPSSRTTTETFVSLHK